MKIIPVIDLMSGHVVLGRAGRRDEYRPVAMSQLCDDATMRSVADGIRSRLGADLAYVADLNAIQGGEPDWPSLQVALDIGLRLWLDAGISTPERAEELLEQGGASIDLVVGLETLTSPDAIEAIVERVGAERVIVSIDLVDGAPLTACSEWSIRDPVGIAGQMVEQGIRRFILLDLHRVGMQQGPGTEMLYRQLRSQQPHLEITCGGGFSSIDELRRFSGLGVDAVLLATMLHRGIVGAKEIEQLRV